MTRKLGYRWNLRQVMAGRGMFQTTDLIGPLADRGIRLSSSQVYRLVTDRLRLRPGGRLARRATRHHRSVNIRIRLASTDPARPAAR